MPGNNRENSLLLDLSRSIRGWNVQDEASIDLDDSVSYGVERKIRDRVEV